MSRSKRETLKFIRIKTRPFYLSGDSDERTVSGYINIYNEFKRWDIEDTEGFTSLSAEQEASITYVNAQGISTVSVAPRKFFIGGSTIGTGIAEDTYRNIVFLINGDYRRYDRRRHDLNILYSRVYQQNPDGTFNNPFDDIGPLKYKESDPSPLTLTFRVNPANIRIQKKKLFRKIRVRAGWAFQHWGPEIGQITIQGTTGNLMPDDALKYAIKNVPLLGDIPIITTFKDERPTELNSPALKALREMETWYDEDQSEIAGEKGWLTALEYRGHVYVGHLADFQVTERGDQPFQLFYTINFVVHYDSSNLQGATSRARSQITRNEKTLATVERLKGAHE